MNQIKTILLLLVCLIVAGCGGGGGGGSSSSAQARVFVTDNLGNYDHVWVMVKEVDLVGPSGTQVVFVSSAGQPLDLPTLNVSGVQHFAFLGLKGVPAGNYTQMVFKLDDQVVLFPHGVNVGQNRTFAGSSGGLASLTVSLSAGQVSGKTDFVGDFDLSQWSDDGVHVTASVREGDRSGLGDDSRHDREDFEGRVSNLAGTAPTFTFDLSQENGTPLHVTTDATTEIFNSNGTPNPALANGERVHVKGTFDPTAGVLAATSVKIQTGGDHDQPDANGAVVSVGVGTFVMTVDEAEGFIPSDVSINVVPDPAAVFIGDDCTTLTSDEFFALLAAGVHVEVAGTYDSASNTFTATRLKVEHGEDGGGGGDGDGHDAQVTGVPSNVNAGAGTFDVTVSEWEGGSLHAGDVVHVVTNGDTHFKDANGETITSTQFFAGMGTSPVEVEGHLAADLTLTARKAKFEH